MPTSDEFCNQTPKFSNIEDSVSNERCPQYCRVKITFQLLIILPKDWIIGHELVYFRFLILPKVNLQLLRLLSSHILV